MLIFKKETVEEKISQRIFCLCVREIMVNEEEMQL